MSGRKASAQHDDGEMVMSKILVLDAAALALSAGAASAQAPGYDYNGATVPLYGYAAPPAYGHAATAPLYNYAAPAYAAPATARTTIIIVTPGSGYSAPDLLLSQSRM